MESFIDLLTVARVQRQSSPLFQTVRRFGSSPPGVNSQRAVESEDDGEGEEGDGPRKAHLQLQSVEASKRRSSELEMEATTEEGETTRVCGGVR